MMAPSGEPIINDRAAELRMRRTSLAVDYLVILLVLWLLGWFLPTRWRYIHISADSGDCCGPDRVIQGGDRWFKVSSRMAWRAS